MSIVKPGEDSCRVAIEGATGEQKLSVSDLQQVPLLCRKPQQSLPQRTPTASVTAKDSLQPSPWRTQ